jgi:hypothetical protein
MEKLAQSGGGTIYVSVKILFARVAAATILTRKASLALAIPFTPRCAEGTSKRQGICDRGLRARRGKKSAARRDRHYS